MSEAKQGSVEHGTSEAGVNGRTAQRKLTPEDVAKLNALTKRMSAAFGEIVGVMMRERQHRFAFLSDLEWMVMPALATGQFAVAEARSKNSGLTAPRAVILWASVSKEIDARLSANPGVPIRLKPAEWASGTHGWLVDAIGDARAIKVLIDQTLTGPLKSRSLKIVTRGDGGKPVVQEMKAPSNSAASGKA